MNNAVFDKAMENLKKQNIRLVSNKEENYLRLLKMDIKIKLFVTKIFDNDLVAIRKIKVILTLNKPAYVEMCL